MTFAWLLLACSTEEPAGELPPDEFALRFADAFCGYVAACAVEVNLDDCESAPRTYTAAECAAQVEANYDAWFAGGVYDAAAAAACLAAYEERTGCDVDAADAGCWLAFPADNDRWPYLTCDTR